MGPGQIISFILNNGVTDATDVEALRKIRLLNVSCALGILVIIPLSVLTLFLNHFLLFIVDVLAVLLCLYSFIYLKKTSQYVRASHCFIHAIFMLLLYAVYTGGVDNTGPVWIFIFPMLVLFLYDLRRGLIYTGLFSGLVLFIFSFPGYLPGAAVYPFEFRIRIICSYLIVVIFAVAYEYFRRQTFIKMEALGRQLGAMARQDSLTGLMNRRGMSEKLEYEYVRTLRSQTPFSIILGDIDLFKGINDRYGHDAGDEVLKEVGRLFTTHTRGQDMVSRWGGEEFLFLLPETGIKGAYTFGEKIRTAVQGLETVYFNHKITVTMSFGIGQIGTDDTIKNGITTADRHLYQAKSRGRNRVLPLPEGKA